MKSKLLILLALTVLAFVSLLMIYNLDRAGYECNDGICIRIAYEGPVQTSVPIVFKISIKTYRDVPNLGISLYGYSNEMVQIIKKPDGAELSYHNNDSLTYRIDAQGGEEYLFVGQMQLEKPEISFGFDSYELITAASRVSGFRVIDSFHIYLDSEGNQIEESEVKLLMETDHPLPTLPPDVTVVPDTPFPTIIWPTDTPLPTATPAASQTLLPYP